jgi:hypothetical protein
MRTLLLLTYQKPRFSNNTFAKIKIPTRKWLTRPPETGFFEKTRFLKSRCWRRNLSKKPGFLIPQMASVAARHLDRTILNDLPPIV